MPARPLTRPERVQARLLTGPLGHLVAGSADVVELLGRLLRARLSR